MKYIIKSLVVIALLGFTNIKAAKAQSNALIAGDFADPSIIRVPGKGYYAVGTSSEWAPHFPVYKSSDLKIWKQTGYVFDKAPEWTSGSFWAPEYYFMNGQYYIYYTARRKSDGVSYIGVATSKFPDKGFQDHGVIINHGKEAIDGFVFNDNGQLYITFKAYGLENRPIEILGYKLSADGMKVIGEPFSLLKDDERQGMEGQSILKKDGFYYLFYSAGNCCGGGCSYNVRVARSKTFKGPYVKYDKNPLLRAEGEWKCTGHGTFVNTPEGKTYYLHHAYSNTNDVFTGRQGMLAELTWPVKGGWPVLKGSAIESNDNTNITDQFKAAKPALYWQWDFRNSTPVIKQGGGKLSLSGTIKEGNTTGVALTVRPVSDNFEVTTTVTNSNSALKGLVFYGDAKAAAGIGVEGKEVQLWIVKDNKREVLAQKALDSAAPVELKLSMRPDRTCKVFYRQDKNDWKELAADRGLDIGFLPQWDRSPRIGLHFKGETGAVAEFSSFTLTNK
ncbi:beta-xylosidase [Mucilaginibacter limnophilus]|uniref:Beta-xylosidase n=1 Tax=Mucilaginibacter limnophilus TaxID=1932778 RepID=A0A3S2UN84_9SPHI|nr:family 43 glycosylhydrolase [Mucilaginibacter limnophilus]RVU00205.1 beta-xylosidase [Mucilaginibacter limnophilus]